LHSPDGEKHGGLTGMFFGAAGDAWRYGFTKIGLKTIMTRMNTYPFRLAGDQ
jgi:hypothetical protein